MRLENACRCAATGLRDVPRRRDIVEVPLMFPGMVVVEIFNECSNPFYFFNGGSTTEEGCPVQQQRVGDMILLVWLVTSGLHVAFVGEKASRLREIGTNPIIARPNRPWHLRKMPAYSCSTSPRPAPFAQTKHGNEKRQRNYQTRNQDLPVV